MAQILVTGGAGYIGSVLTEELLAEGHDVIVVDNLSRGHVEAVDQGAFFVQTDLNDWDALSSIFQTYSIEVVMHLAALTSVEESVREPQKYFDNNVTFGLNLIHAMHVAGVKKIVFSSSAAVYGQPKQIPITESTPTNPINPYGSSKLEFERILNSYIYNRTSGISSITLRYFNVAGASQRFGPYHDPETNLIPIVMKVALGQREKLDVFGTDYDTRDGTCIRDYIHVIDIARAHILAFNILQENGNNRIYNLGNGEGYSVYEVINTAREVTGKEIPVEVKPRRPGDPASLIASCSLAQKELGWQPQHSSLEEIIRSAWDWQQLYPNGY